MNIAYDPVHIWAITHPLEKEAILDIQNNGLYDYIAKMIGSISVQIGAKADMMLNGYPVTEKTSPRLYKIYQTVLKRLHCDQKYDLYVDFGYDLIANTYGSGKTGHLIQLNSACLTHLTDSELAALLGQQIGHIQADHIQTRELLKSLDLVVNFLPVANNIVKDTIWGFFAKWMVASEYTADRAALIACQDTEAVASLMLKQMGVSAGEEMIRKIYHQEVRELPKKLGMYYVMMAQSMPTFGMSARIQEICKWSLSQEFREKYAYTHYSARLLLQDVVADNNDEKLMLLHRRAAGGNTIAQALLGELYLFGKNGLDINPAIGLALLEKATFGGSGNAMYLYSHCMEREIHGLKQNQQVFRHLRWAAWGREDELKSKIPAVHVPLFKDLPVIIKAFAQKHKADLMCTVNTVSVGDPIEYELAQTARDAFWMQGDTAVYAMEMTQIEDQWYGTAIADKGIFGRISGDRYPFWVTWKQYQNSEVCKRHKDGSDYIFCDDQKILGIKELRAGSLADVLVTIWMLMNKR